MKRYLVLILLLLGFSFSLHAGDFYPGKYHVQQSDTFKYKYLGFNKDGTLILSGAETAMGFYTLQGDTLKFLLTGASRIDNADSVKVVRFGDTCQSLVYYNKSFPHPLSVSELSGNPIRDSMHMKVLHLAGDTIKMEYKGQVLIAVNQDIEASGQIKEAPGPSIMSILRGLLGMVVLIFIGWIFSTNRRAISWRVILTGLGIQALLAVGILKVPFVKTMFEFVGQIFVKILDFSRDGAEFLLGDLIDVDKYGYIFAFQILPTIIFFSALTSVLFYLGIIQKVVYVLAWALSKLLKISGAESLSVAGNIFLGQTESPLMIKAYLEKMNKSEILLVMIGGMATVAGGVLAAYVGFLGGADPAMRLLFAKHLLAASVMAAPGAIVVSKLLAPQAESVGGKVEVSKEKVGSNFLDAMANGTTEGLKLAANVAAMLLVFVAFIAMFNFIVGKIGDWTHLNASIASITGGSYDKLSLQFILGYTFAPLMWLIGVSGPDIDLVGRLLGEKIIMSEFVGYISLADLKDAKAFTEEKSIIMATYMLCGFANFASIGIQIGGIGSLAPGQRKQLSKFGMRALLGGSLASLLSATLVGMIMG